MTKWRESLKNIKVTDIKTTVRSKEQWQLLQKAKWNVKNSIMVHIYLVQPLNFQGIKITIQICRKQELETKIFMKNLKLEDNYLNLISHHLSSTNYWLEWKSMNFLQNVSYGIKNAEVDPKR